MAARKRYLIIMLLLNIFYCYGQTPGGVNGAELWFKTVKQDALPQIRYEWTDFSGDGSTLNRNGSSVTYSVSADSAWLFNFSPAVQMPAVTNSLRTELQNSSLEQSTQMGVFAPLLLSNCDSLYIETRFNSLRPLHSLLDEVGSMTLQFPSHDFNGYMPEFIVWQRVLSPLERLRAESYLAMKHGITLNSSYYDNVGNLIWDKDANITYHHRVTGISYNSTYGSKGLCLSSTSNEYNLISGQRQYKTAYDNDNDNNLPSPDHLLVMGYEFGGGFLDGEYAIWGDNGLPTTTNDEPNSDGWHLMPRQWLMCSQLTERVDTATFSSNDFLVRYPSTNTYSLHKGSNAYHAFFRLNQNVSADNFVMEFSCPVEPPLFEFGMGINDYCMTGYRILSDGSLIKYINNGQAQQIMNDANGHSFLLRKTEQSMVLLCDGQAIDNSQIISSYWPPYPLISCHYQNGILRLENLRITHMQNAHFQTILSYSQAGDPKLEAHRYNRSFLIIDPTGNGDFSTDNTQLRYERCYDFNPHLQTLTFRDIQWDLDGNGKDVFTFGWCDSLIAEYEPTKATCASNGDYLATGRIDVNVICGSPAYDYELRAEDVNGYAYNQLVTKGHFATYTHPITGLLPGSYRLTLSQRSGMNLFSSSINQNQSIENLALSMPDSVCWTVGDLSSHYSIIMTLPDGNRLSMSVDGDSLYLTDLYQNHTSHALDIGNFIKIKFNQSYIKLLIDNDVFYNYYVSNH